MYRKHLKQMESKTGSKTIDRISEIPVVTSALLNVTDYYGKVKETNALLRTSCNLAELSLKTMAFAATPITTICKKPIDTVDSFFYEKVEALECAFPVLSKPTELLTSEAKEVYDKKIKKPIESLYVIKDKKVDEIKLYSTNKVQAVATYSYDVVDKVLENKFAKILTDPVLNFTEKSIGYWMPAVESTTNTDQGTTLRRIYDINNRVYKHLYQSTFAQLNKLHFQFEKTIEKLNVIKDIMGLAYAQSKDTLAKAAVTAKNNTLVKQCLTYIEKNNISLQNGELVARNYFTKVLTDVTQLLEKYMVLVKNFPVSVNGSKLKQTIETLTAQLNKDSFTIYLNLTIDNLKKINQALLGYTNQMFQVVSDSKITQLLSAKSNELKSGNGGVVKKSN